MRRREWALVAVGVIVSIFVVITILKKDSHAGVWSENTVKGGGKDKIVQLFVEGAITENKSLGSTFSLEGFLSQLDQAVEDPDVKGVVIRVNSPGGEVTASDDIYNKILEVKEAKKNVIVSMGGLATSGGYYISTAADKIFANRSTITGSLGVIFSFSNYKKAADWLGYQEIRIKSGDFKDIGSPMKDITSEERNIYQSIVEESYDQFVEIISKERKLTRDRVLQIADGRVYSGSQAKKLGLIDEFGSLEDATDYLMKQYSLSEATIVRYDQGASIFSLLSGLNQKVSAPLTEVIENVLPQVQQSPTLLAYFQP